MTLWIVLLLIAVLLSPLFWLLPSPRQRGRMAIRLEARRQGLGMQLVPREWPHWLASIAPSPCPQYYCVRRQRHDCWRYWQMRPGVWVDRWREENAVPAALATALRQLPADVFEIEATAAHLFLYWGEQNAEEKLPCIVHFIDHWS